ncbi:MAG TPA: 2-oxo acid dehydrogenase subunit E2 [Blastocatellia bacterium]|nr:2-oxo acid dehydrogenase subunit E2 [Blastocatellia bacterium]
MSTEITLPKLGENVDSGVVSKVLVSAGDVVTEDQPVIELETEKATVEVPAMRSGTVSEVRVKEGETIKVGQVILTVDAGAEAVAEEREPEPEAKPEERLEEKAEAQEKPPAEEIKREEVSRPAPPGPAMEARPIGDGGPAPSAQPARYTVAQPAPARELAPAAPSVRRLARELGVDINEVTGSGPGGRISEEDVRNYARSIILNVSRPQPAERPEAPRLPDFSRWGEVERKTMSLVRRKTAERVHDSWTAIPHVTQFDAADITELEALRLRFAAKAEEAGGKLTITAIALKVVAAVLKAFPQFNASLDLEQEEIIYKKYYNIGVAVDTDRGLLVPVIRDADKKNLVELSVELTQVAERARQKKITIEEMQGGTFTITNLGGIGGSSFTPIVNSPEVAILGISRASNQPVYVDGRFEPRLMLPLALSYDHRLIDGADAARFLRRVAEALEQPFLLILEG